MEVAVKLFTDTISLADFVDVVDPITDKYVIGVENPLSNRHFQGYLFLNIKDDSRFNKVRTEINKLPFPKSKGKLSVVAKRKNTLPSYCLKDGEYTTKGLTDEEVNELRSKSFKKKLGFKGEVEHLEIAFMKGNIDCSTMIDMYKEIHENNRINHSPSKIEAFIYRMLCQKDPEYNREYLNKIKNKFSAYINKEKSNGLPKEIQTFAKTIPPYLQAQALYKKT